MQFNPDSPISGTPESEDLLGRDNFCAELSKRILLRAGSPGLALSLEGAWGSGKTSAINLIARHLRKLDEEQRPIIVEFNPWMVGSLNSLVQEFFLQMGSAIGLSPHAERAREVSKSLLAYSQLISFAKWIPGAEPLASIAANLLKGAGKAVQAAADLSDLNIAEHKKRVSESIVELGKPFVVFIDDLDRLPPDEVFAMVRLVKAVSDFPQLAYVIAFDPAYVEKALERSGIESGRAYLDKIVPVRVSLPRIGLAQISRIVDREAETLGIEESLDVFPGERDRLVDLYHHSIKFLLRTPRDVYRVFNRLRLVHPVTKTEVGIADLFGLETIAITAPQLYDHIRGHPQAYVGSLPEDKAYFKKPDEVVKTLESERREALGKSFSVLQPHLGDLLGRLFPLTTTGWTSDEKRPARTTGRIASPENLVIALSGGLAPSDVSLSQVRAFLEEPDKRRPILLEVGNLEMLEDFLDLVNVSLRRAGAPPDPANLLGLLCEIAELDVVKEINRRHGVNMLKVRVGVQAFWIVRQLLEYMDREQARETVQRVVGSPRMLALSTDLLRFLCNQQGRLEGARKEPEESWLVSAEDLCRLIEVWTQGTLSGFLSGDAFASNEAGPAFFLLEALDPASVRRIAGESLGSPEGSDRLARTFGRTGCDSVKGYYAEVSESKLGELADATQFRRVAEQRLADAHLDAELRAIYSSILSGKKHYVVDFQSDA